MILTPQEKQRVQGLTPAPDSPQAVTALQRRVNYLKSLNGEHTIKEMVTLLYDALGHQITNTNLYAFCERYDIPYQRERAPRRTKRGKALDINSTTSNGQNKVEYTTLNKNDYVRFN